jgi:sarcosine oxidase subunit delta
LLLIDCPHCGPRAEIEFRYAGEAHIVRPGPDADEETWSRYLYMRDNARGEHAERWRHAQGCGQFFNALRDTVSDRIAHTYPAGEARSKSGADT